MKKSTHSAVEFIRDKNFKIRPYCWGCNKYLSVSELTKTQKKELDRVRKASRLVSNKTHLQGTKRRKRRKK